MPFTPFLGSVESFSGVEKIARTSVRRLGRFCYNSRMPNMEVRASLGFLRQSSALKGFSASSRFQDPISAFDPKRTSAERGPVAVHHSNKPRL
jgi:hypothetical protein